MFNRAPKFKDSDFKNAPVDRHPDFQPYLAFNDKPGSPTIYFESHYDDEVWCKKHKGITPKQMKAIAPHLYYYPELPANRIIEIKQGGFARIPHSFFTVSSRDGRPVTYSVRSEGSL